MHSFNIFILSILETLGFIILYLSINTGFNKKFKKIVYIVISTSLVVAITDFLDLSYGLIINYAYLFFIVKYMFNSSFKKTFVDVCIVITMCILIQLIIIFSLNIINTVAEIKLEFARNLIINLFFLFVSYTINRNKLFQKITFIYKKIDIKVYFFCFNLIFYSLIVKFIWEYRRSVILNDSIVFFIVPLLFIIGNTMLMLYNNKNTEQRKALEHYEKYNPVITQLIGDVRRRQHDFKNHLNTIYGIAHVEEEYKVKNTIKQYINSLNFSLIDIENLAYIDNKVVSAIIYNKINEAQLSGIKFTYDLPNGSMHFPLMDYELSEVLNNLLDNAFEAVKEEKIGFKEVSLKIDNVGEYSVIKVSNNGVRIKPNHVPLIFNKGFSTKRSDGHGFGLYNIKKIVESYKGTIELSFEDDYIIFTINFILNQPNSNELSFWEA